MTTTPQDVRVDEHGVHLSSADDVVVDVLFDDRRVWSFWTERDTTEGPHGRRTAAWPRPLRKYLDGHAVIRVREHTGEVDLFAQELRFGTGDGQIAVENDRGKPLGIDKSGRLVMTFETRTAAQVEPLLDSVQVVLDGLTDAGVDGFLAYGSLLGAVRDGALIGHDSDADLGYVSRCTTPVDVIRESFRIQRALVRSGLTVVRYSGGGLKVIVREADGSRRGLDVFTGFLDDGHLVLMGEIREPFREEWIWPLGTATLEGREFPVPAAPEHLLAATYGPGWKVPDPAFKFETPASTHRRLNDWFRGIAVHRADWDRRYASRLRTEPAMQPYPLARRMFRVERRHRPYVVDLGCGRGADAWWLAGRGLPTVGLDFSAHSYAYLQERIDERPLEYAPINLLETRQALAWGARIAAVDGHRVVLGRHIVDAVPPRGRANLRRLLRMACTGGGRAYLEFLTSDPDGDPWAEQHQLQRVDPRDFAEQLVADGATVVDSTELRTPDMRVNLNHDPRRATRRAHRLVVEWPG